MVSFVSVLIAFCLAHQVVARIAIPIPENYSLSNGARIVGGKDATNISIPWMASLTLFGNHFCGASIINPHTLVTAAHCLDVKQKEYIKVRVGSKDRYGGGSLLQIKDYYIHENYTSTNFHNDIGLIFMKKEIKFEDDIVDAISLPDDGSLVRDGSLAMVSGWGLLKYNSGFSPRTLQYVKVPVINRDKCNSLMQNLITDKQFCAGFMAGGKDACQQDSGGPLVYNKKLIGIVSWGDECAKAGHPGVYTDVAALRLWIDSHIKIHN